MSSLIFYTDEDCVLVATDTLGVTPNGEPFIFISKATYIPHLKTIVAGTGGGGFANQWSLTASTRMIARGIQNLDSHTPQGLRELWSSYLSENSLSELDEFTTTVYQLGISEETNKVVSFAYRSTNNFESEELQYGISVKPECNVPDGELLKLIPAMMQEQREMQELQPKESRIYIGGEIYALFLTNEGCNSIKLGEFPDFKKLEHDVFSNHEKQKR